METATEVKKIKINVTNIKSVLMRSNKKLRNVEKQKSYLTRRQEEQEKRILLEKKIETPRRKLKIPLLGKVVGVAKSIWDRLVNFFGWLLAGFIITRLPQIVENLKKRLAFIKPIWEGAMKTFAIIGKGMSGVFRGMRTLYNLRQSIGNLSRAEADLKNINKELKDMKSQRGGDGSTIEESSTQQNVNNTVSGSSSENNMGNMNQNEMSVENEVDDMTHGIKKENRKITKLGKRSKEKNTRETLNPRLDSKLNKNITVRSRTSQPVLNQKGPLAKDVPVKTEKEVIVQTKFKWWNPFTYGSRQKDENPGVKGTNSGDAAMGAQ